MKIKDKYYKETEHLLYNYKMFQISIENMQQEIELLKKEDGSSGIAYDGITTSPTHKFQSLTEDTALSVMEKIDYLEHSIRRIQSRLDSINKALEGLTHTEKIIIEKKYIESKQWWQVTAHAQYSERHCKRIRNQAINKIVIGINGDEAIENQE